MSRKKYTTMEKLSYHNSRLNNSKVSDNKKTYSRNWLDGYHEPNFEFNLVGVKSELRGRRKNKVPFSAYDISLLGYQNGMKERSRQIKSMKRRKKYN